MPYIGAAQKEGADYSAQGRNPSVFLCPSDDLSGSAYDATSYAYSAALYHSPDQIAGMHLRNLIIAVNDPGPGALCSTQTGSSVSSPSSKVLLTEWYDSHDHGSGAAIGFWGTLQAGLVPGNDRWDGSRVYAFTDGHVAYLKARRIKPSADDCPDVNLTPEGSGGSDVE